MKTRYILMSLVLFGLILVSLSLLFYQPSPFFSFNWIGLTLLISGTFFFALLFKYPKFSQYALFIIGILAMLNAYFYFKQCSNLKGLEVSGGFLVSVFSLFLK
jgi:hypothetical protein